MSKIISLANWNTNDFSSLYQVNKRSALKAVADNNIMLTKKKCISIPATCGIDVPLEIGITENYFKYKVMFLKETTDIAIRTIANATNKVVALNFADSNIPGGLYLNGEVTQEEELCRTMPSLYQSLVDSGEYPFDCYKKVLYTPNVIVMRDSHNNYNFLDPSEHKKAGIISAVAPNDPAKFNIKKVYETLKTAFLIPKIFDETNVIILGAWGCGAFGNDPTTIANIFLEIIRKYGNYYKFIYFSIPPGPNYDAFHKVFEKYI